MQLPMDREATAEELSFAARRGEEAKRLLGEQVYRDAVSDTRDGLAQQWIASTDPAEHQRLWAQVHALDAVETTLRRYINEGEHANAVLRKRQ